MEKRTDNMARKIKMMHFIHGMSAGGAETLVKNYMTNFDRKKFELVVLCLYHCDKSPYEKMMSDANIRMIFVQDYLPFKKRKNIFQKMVNYPFRYIVVPKIIQREHPDIIHTHLQINRFLLFAKIRKETKLFHTIHNELDKLYPRNSIRKRIDLFVTKRIVKRHGVKFIVLHDKMKAEVDKLFDVSDSIVLNNGVDVDKIHNSKNSTKVRNDLKIPHDSFVVGHIGRFSVQKNHKFLVDIFASLKDKKGNAFLLMVGDGVEKEAIIKKLNNAGYVDSYLILSNRNDVPDLLNAMDVFVFPSLYEGLPLSLIEAQIAKKPSFISDTINCNAVISNLVKIISLKDGASEWANAIEDFEKPKKIEVHDKEWDIKTITKQLEDIYVNSLVEK